ncbi:MAG: hypothetical protein AAF702_28525 [Chloroflexota bacterium]
MIHDIFTEDFLKKAEQRSKVMASVFGFLIFALVVFFIVEQLQSDMEMLRSDTNPNGSKIASERLADLKAKEEATTAALALIAEATRTPTPTGMVLIDGEQEDSTNSGEEIRGVAGAPPEVVDLFNRGACNGCHVIPGIPGAVGVIGPNLSAIGIVAGERQEGVSAYEYIYESLINPEAFIAPECPTGSCPTGVMLPTFTQSFNEGEIEQMVDYLIDSSTN